MDRSRMPVNTSFTFKRPDINRGRFDADFIRKLNTLPAGPFFAPIRINPKTTYTRFINTSGVAFKRSLAARRERERSSMVKLASLRFTEWFAGVAPEPRNFSDANTMFNQPLATSSTAFSLPRLTPSSASSMTASSSGTASSLPPPPHASLAPDAPSAFKTATINNSLAVNGAAVVSAAQSISNFFATVDEVTDLTAQFATYPQPGNLIRSKRASEEAAYLSKFKRRAIADKNDRPMSLH